MKAQLLRFFARVLLFSYALLMLKPVMPFIRDRVAHTFHAKAHFRVVHSHDGSSHVHAEVSKQVREEEPGATKRGAKQVEEPVLHTIVAMAVQEQMEFEPFLPKPACCYICIPADNVSARDYPPPRA